MASKDLIIVDDMENFPPGNPIHHDGFNMGTRMGSNLMLMYGNGSKEECKYLILVNPQNGKRLRIRFDRNWNLKPDAPGIVMWCRTFRTQTGASLKEAIDEYFKTFSN